MAPLLLQKAYTKTKDENSFAGYFPSKKNTNQRKQVVAGSLTTTITLTLM